MLKEQTDQTIDPLEQLRQRHAANGGDKAKSGDQEKDAKQASLDARRKWRSHYSDRQLADRFIASRNDVRFIGEYAQWYLYSSERGVWERGTEFAVRGLIQDFLKEEFTAAQKDGSTTRLDEAEVCQRTYTAKRVLDWMTPNAVTSITTFDTHKDLIVVANGVVDLRTTALLPFDPDLLLTQRIPFPYVAGAKNKWTDMAIDSLPPDAHHQFQVMAGQALTGHQPSRSTIFFLWGGGSNGKSTLIDLLSATAGDYGAKPVKEVLLKGGSNSNFHTIVFKGIRQAMIEELPDERFLDGGVVRDLAGTTTMTGEHKGKDVEEFEILATIFITFNNRPQVLEAILGVWRRLRLFQFPYTYVEDRSEVTSPLHKLQDPMLKDLHKKSEQAVIAFLAWRIEGARLWYEAGRRDPADAPSVERATHEWRMMNDVLAHWFEENLVADPGSFVLVDDLLDDFNQWRNTPKATWGKHNLVDKLTSHSLFQEHALELKRAARHSGLRQSTWMRANPADWDQARPAKTQATFVRGLRFRNAADDLTVPDDASELLAPEEPTLSGHSGDADAALIEDEGGVW